MNFVTHGAGGCHCGRLYSRELGEIVASDCNCAISGLAAIFT